MKHTLVVVALAAVLSASSMLGGQAWLSLLDARAQSSVLQVEGIRIVDPNGAGTIIMGQIGDPPSGSTFGINMYDRSGTARLSLVMVDGQPLVTLRDEGTIILTDQADTMRAVFGTLDDGTAYLAMLDSNGRRVVTIPGIAP